MAFASASPVLAADDRPAARGDGRHVVSALSRRHRRHVHGAHRHAGWPRAGTRCISCCPGTRAGSARDGEGGVRIPSLQVRARFRSMNIFGYAGALEADERLRGAAVAAAPLASPAAWRAASTLADRIDATMVHGHWVVPGGVIAAAAAGRRPLVVSLHGSDVFVAERHGVVGRAARWAFGRAGFVTACSEDLASGPWRSAPGPIARPRCPYGVDASRFRPEPGRAAPMRAALGCRRQTRRSWLRCGPLRPQEGIRVPDRRHRRAWSPRRPRLRLVLAGDGDLRREFDARITRLALGARAILPGVLHQDEVADSLAAADVVVVPSVRDPSGNVDGLPNVVMEALASGAALVATPAGGIGSVVQRRADGPARAGGRRRRACDSDWTFARRQRWKPRDPGRRRAALGGTGRQLEPCARRLRARRTRWLAGTANSRA